MILPKWVLNLFKKEALSDPPYLDEHIEITWLPNPKNNPCDENCYIGMTGVVQKKYADGSFDLKTDCGAVLLVGKKYKYRLTGKLKVDLEKLLNS